MSWLLLRLVISMHGLNMKFFIYHHTDAYGLMTHNVTRLYQVLGLKDKHFKENHKNSTGVLISP
jgi:hypothetical protein